MKTKPKTKTKKQTDLTKSFNPSQSKAIHALAREPHAIVWLRDQIISGMGLDPTCHSTVEPAVNILIDLSWSIAKAAGSLDHNLYKIGTLTNASLSR